MLAYCVGISGGQLRVSCKVFHAANAARHELVHTLADLNHAVLKPCADLLLGMLHECAVQNRDDRAERDYSHQQKSKDQFFSQRHGVSFLISRSPSKSPEIKRRA